MSVPDVSVIVISYNDAARLPRAIRSIQRQTLRNLEIVVVDDASTDGTEAVVRGLAAADPRIRLERLERNSGGCSAPRNRGVELARAPWVMFCDSDDEYERHACKNLLEAAERLDADIVCGTAERVDVATGRTRRWRPEVHEAERSADGLAAFPELLYDTISVNKIYRRSLLDVNAIRFPEGLLFEDQLFTLEAFAAARRVAAIPETVYRWYVDRLSDEPSITQRRHEAANVESRVEVNRRIDRFLADRGLTDIRALKDHKFLRHDLYLYLSSMLEVDDDTAEALIARLVPYVSTMDLASAWLLRPGLRVAIYHLLVGDLEGIRSAMRLVKWASVVDETVVADGDRELWGCAHLESGADVAGRPAAEWLDVTAMRLLRVPFSQRRYLHRVESMSVSAGVVTATGSTVDYDGALASADGIELRFLVNGDRSAVSVPATWTGTTGIRRTWTASGPLSDRLPRRLQAKDRGTLGLAITRGGLENLTTARSPEAGIARVTVPFPGATSWTGPDALTLTASDSGAIGWRAVRTSGGRSRLAAWQARWLRIPGMRRIGIVTALVRRDAIPALLHRLGALLPARELALFETDGGRTAAGSARALSEQLNGDGARVAQAWVHRGQPERVPAWAEPVERLSLRHHWLASRARYAVDDGTSSLGVRLRRDAVAVHAGSGVPVHRIGLDDPSILVSRAASRDVVRRGKRTRLLLAASRFDADITRAALAIAGEASVTGLARMDAAVRVRSEGADAVRALRERLDLPGDRRIVVYAPTARSFDREPRDPLIDLDDWAMRLGDSTYLLVRPHPAERFVVSTRLRSAVRDIGDSDDLGLFLAAADLMVSDYSSVIGDAALIGLPVLLFQPDRDVFVSRTRGLYAHEGSPGPTVTTMDALIGEVQDWAADPTRWADRHGPESAVFARDHCGAADGRSSERAVAAVLAGRHGGGR